MKPITKAGQEATVEANFTFDIVASDTVNINPLAAGIHANKTGYYNLLFTAKTLPTKLFLVAGVTYPFRIIRLFITDTDPEVVDGLTGLQSIFTENDRA